MANLTAREQLMLELINRARMDPKGEAERLGVTLGEKQGKPVQVLAGNDELRTAAYNHSGWMLINNTFSSIETKGSKSFIAKTAIERMVAYGYAVTGEYAYGESVSWTGAATTPDFTQAIVGQHETLFAGGASRARLLKPAFQEVGIGQQAGSFLDGGETLVASMVTQDFMRAGAKVFITGVIYTDIIDNDFYDAGEGIAGRKVAGSGASDKTGAGGGYELQYGATGIATMTFKLAGPDLKLDVAVGTANVKVDAVNGREIWTNGSVQSQSGAIKELHALGVSKLVLIGSGTSEEITGNRAANQLLGLGGSDTIDGGAGKDGIMGGPDGDLLTGGNGADLFVYASRKESLPIAPDVITDFGVGADRIDLGDVIKGKLKFIGESAYTAVNQVALAQIDAGVVVRVNLDADAADEMQILLAGAIIADIAKGDFIL